MPLSLRQKQALFACLIAKLISYVYDHPGWEVTFAEGYVGDTDAADGDYDGPHMKDGGHYMRLAIDLNLFIEGSYIKSSEHPAWQTLGKYWEGLHSLCRWGGRFGKRDANHFSLVHEGRA